MARHGTVRRRRRAARPYREARPPSGRRRGRRRGRSSSTVIPTTAFLGAFVAIALLVSLGHAAATTTPQVSAPPEAPPIVAPREPETNDRGDEVREGRDYAFQGRINGEPIHWSCSNSIPVAIEGKAPAGAAAALELVIDRLVAASNLPLTVEPSSVLRHDGNGAIRIRYVNEGESAFGMQVSGKIVGKGGPIYSSDGMIQSGRVVVRNDMDPTTDTGQQVLMHEIGHALGLDHSEEGVPEVMTPTSPLDAKPVLGHGDRIALAVVGC